MTATRTRTRWGFEAGMLALLAAAGVWSPACTKSSNQPGCLLTMQVALPQSPLTLLRAAQLHRVSDSFTLIGVDGDRVRWAGIAADGRLLPEASFVVPAHTLGPWAALSGATAAGDRMIIAWGQPKTGDAATTEIVSVALAADGSGGAAPKAVFEVATADAAGTKIALGTSRTGLRAGLAWAPPGANVVKYTLLGGDGQPIIQPVDMTARPVECLTFMPSASDMTLGFYNGAGEDAPDFRFANIKDNGAIDANNDVSLSLSATPATCPVGTPTANGYAAAWQSDEGTFLVSYVASSGTFTKNSVVDAARWGGPASQPPIGGLAWTGKDLTLVFEKATGPEAWRIDLLGEKVHDPLVLPSDNGQVGRFTASPHMNALFGSYADYGGMSGGGSNDAGGAADTARPQDADGAADGGTSDGGASDGGASDGGTSDGGGNGGGTSDGGGNGGGSDGPEHPAVGRRWFVKVECP